MAAVAKAIGVAWRDEILTNPATSDHQSPLSAFPVPSSPISAFRFPLSLGALAASATSDPFRALLASRVPFRGDLPVPKFWRISETLAPWRLKPRGAQPFTRRCPSVSSSDPTSNSELPTSSAAANSATAARQGRLALPQAARRRIALETLPNSRTSTVLRPLTVPLV